MARYPSKSLVSSEVHSSLPYGSAVYRLYAKGVCIYVGATSRLCERLWAHHLRGIFDEIRYKQVPVEELYWAEVRWIQQYNPTLNKMRNGGYPTSRLRRRTPAAQPQEAA